jgi:hypothetical protein
MNKREIFFVVKRDLADRLSSTPIFQSSKLGHLLGKPNVGRVSAGATGLLRCSATTFAAPLARGGRSNAQLKKVFPSWGFTPAQIATNHRRSLGAE